MQSPRSNKWLYGDAWEQFPMEEGEVWTVDDVNKLAVWNLFDELPMFMYDADLIFVDPPWNLGNINCFYTKAGRSDYLNDYVDFVDILFERIAEVSPVSIYVEIGNQYVDLFYQRLSALYKHIQRWPVTYYKKHPTCIIRGSQRDVIERDFTGLDEAECIKIVTATEKYDVIGDFCMGMGLVGLAAYETGKNFVGIELNKRRLANLLQKLDRRGARVSKGD